MLSSNLITAQLLISEIYRHVKRRHVGRRRRGYPYPGVGADCGVGYGDRGSSGVAGHSLAADVSDAGCCTVGPAQQRECYGRTRTSSRNH